MKPYSPPWFLRDQTVENIHRNMLANLPDGWDKSQGQFLWDFTRPTAIEKARMIEFNLNETLKVIWPQWAYDEWLDLHGDYVSVTRKGANRAAAKLHIEGKPGIFFPEGFQFSTASTADKPGIVFSLMEAATMGDNGVIDLWVEAEDYGIIGNVPADTIKLMVKPLAGISYVGNPKVATGGAEAESDTEYRPRVLDGYERLNESYVGCDKDYVRWAKEVDGVGQAVTIPEWLGPGTGTVKIVCTDRAGQPANDLILQEVYNHIMRPDDRLQRLAPIDAILTVVAPVMIPISISATLSLKPGVSLESVKALFLEQLAAYFEEAVEDHEIRLSKIGARLSATMGVADYTDLLVNGQQNNIPITVEQFPCVEEVRFRAQ